MMHFATSGNVGLDPALLAGPDGAFTQVTVIQRGRFRFSDFARKGIQGWCRFLLVVGMIRCTQKRFRIETFFSDEKSRGFYLHKSHLSYPERLGNLMIAVCLADLWIIYLRLTALREDWVCLIHLADHCDWSLFHLGLVLLDYFFNEELPIPVSSFTLEQKSVW